MKKCLFLIVMASLLATACASRKAADCPDCATCTTDDGAAAATVEAGFTSLFDGTSLAGWRINESPETFSVRDGMIVVKGNRSHMFYEGPVNNHEFKNFHLKAQVMTQPVANSGIYFHTAFQPDGWPAKGFEAQVNNTHSDRKKTGGLYAVKDVIDVPPAQDNLWFDYDIIVEGKHVIIKVNGKITTDWTEPTPPAPPQGMPGRVISSGTIAIQGHDPGSVVFYRNIRIKALP